MAEKLIGWDEDGIFLILKENGKTYSALPAFEDMTLEELLEYKARVTDKIRSMDENEPKRRTADAKEAWEDLHEDLEDIRDEVAEYIDVLK